jgi:hypothetical protein
VDGDNREKYHETVKSAAVTMYIEGCGFRAIARILRKIFSIKINYQLVIYWIKKLGKTVELQANTASESKSIPVLELDELFSYVQKKRTKSEYGLLLIETGCVLLHLKSETELPTPSSGCGQRSKTTK